MRVIDRCTAPTGGWSSRGLRGDQLWPRRQGVQHFELEAHVTVASALDSLSSVGALPPRRLKMSVGSAGRSEHASGVGECVEFCLQRDHQRGGRKALLQHREAVAVVLESAASHWSANSGSEPQLADLGQLVGGEHRQRVVAGVGDLITKRGLASRVAGDPLVVADGPDDFTDSAAEPGKQLRRGRIGLLERVVQQTGSNHMIRRTRLVEQRRDLERVQDERGAVNLTMLSVVQSLRIRERRLRLGSRLMANSGVRFAPINSGNLPTRKMRENPR